MLRRTVLKSVACWIATLFVGRTATAGEPRTLYWVGGQDNWDAKKGKKWSLSSGGRGGEDVPRTGDSVVIDQADSVVTYVATTLRTIHQVVCIRGTLNFSGSRDVPRMILPPEVDY